MKKIALSSLLIFTLCLTMLSACGGGGGGGTPPPPQPTSAVLTLSTAVTGTIPADTIIAGYDVTIDLPTGVTVKSSMPPQADASVVTPSGTAVGAGVLAKYTPATGSSPGKLHIMIASTQDSGFTAGEFSKVNVDIASGSHPKATDFQQPTFAASGLVTSPTRTTVDLTGELSLTASTVINY